VRVTSTDSGTVGMASDAGWFRSASADRSDSDSARGGSSGGAAAAGSMARRCRNKEQNGDFDSFHLQRFFLYRVKRLSKKKILLLVRWEIQGLFDGAVNHTIELPAILSPNLCRVNVGGTFMMSPTYHLQKGRTFRRWVPQAC
jgi:hypothetical protein